MKYIVFFLTLFIAVPVGYQLSLKKAWVEKLVFFFMIFFTVKEVTINFVSREWYRGTSRGFEIGLVDIALLIIWQLVLHRKKIFPIKGFPPGTWIYLLYFLFSWISITNSAPGYVVNSYFELWKMIRMFLYFWVVYNYVNSWDKFDLLMKYIAVIVIYVTFEVLKQKYVEGRFQCPGPFPHQNSLVMYMIIFNSLVFGYLLNKKNIKIYFWLAVFGMGSICIISTLSRAGMACFVIACILVWFFSFVGGFSAKKVGITFILMCFALIGLLQALDSIVERFETAPKESGMTRIALAKAAVNMANDKLFGVGLNNFGVKINPPYPYGSHIYSFLHDGKEAPPDLEEKNGLVETTYLMIAAETGWHNLAVFLILLLTFYYWNYKNYRTLRKTNYNFFSIGLMGGLAGIYLESTLEWVLKQTNNFYQLMLIFALIAAAGKISSKEKKIKQAAIINARKKYVESKREKNN